MPADRYDVIVVGTGPGGATLAHRLAPSGKRILLIERGDYLPRSQANGSNALDVHMANLRRKVGEGVIRTVRGVGYVIDQA